MFIEIHVDRSVFLAKVRGALSSAGWRQSRRRERRTLSSKLELIYTLGHWVNIDRVTEYLSAILIQDKTNLYYNMFGAFRNYVVVKCPISSNKLLLLMHFVTRAVVALSAKLVLGQMQDRHMYVLVQHFCEAYSSFIFELHNISPLCSKMSF